MYNVSVLRGRLSSDPRPTPLGSGDLLVRYEVTVERSDGPADSVPVAWIGPPRSAPPASLATGDLVVVAGRVRRRWYRSGSGGARSATEVLAIDVVPVRRRAVATRLVRAALDVAGATPDEGSAR